MSIALGSVEVLADHVNMQVHRVEDDIVHILSVITGAKGNRSDGTELDGVVVDIDSIRNIELTDYSTFVSDLEPKLEQLRLANKVKFFDCLSEATIKEMGPIYE